MSTLQTVRLEPVDSALARAIARDLAGRHRSTEDAAFLRHARVIAEGLPLPVRWALNDFRVTEEHAACLITGMAVDDAALGPTPDRFGGQASPALTLEPDLFFFLCGALLGDAIGWETQQDGRLMHDSLAVRAGGRTGVPARRVKVPWHTEDTSHPCRADYVGLMCLRDPDEIPTTFASIADVRLDPADVDVLFQPRFPLSTTDPHLAIDPDEAAARGEVDHIAVLFGNRDQPYLRIDPYLMPAMPSDPVAAAALGRLVAALDAAMVRVVLRPGEVLFVDNYRAVHGRQGFRPRFDGTGRWLKGLNIVRDLRRSRPLRRGVEDRVIHGR